MGDAATLSWKQKISYSVGHYHNDLVSIMWLTYILVYMTQVVQTTSACTGFFLMLAQVSDALWSLFVGYECDHSPGLLGYSKRKSWHLIGTFLLSVSFPFIFLPILGGNLASDVAKVIYYSPFMFISFCGYAFIQVSHLTLVTEISAKSSERLALYSYRNVMTLAAYFTFNGLAFFIFNNTNHFWTPDDKYSFMVLVFLVQGIGLSFTIPFHIFTKEPNNIFQSLQSPDEQNEKKMNWKDWLKEKQFYVVCVAYVAVRLLERFPQAYWPLYLTSYLNLNKKYAAIIPLLIYGSGFVTSLLMEKINSLIGIKMAFLMGGLIVAVALVWMNFIDQSSALQIFGPAIIIGVGSTILFISSLSTVADLVGNNTSSASFIYGVMNFLDKVFLGLFFMIVQVFQPTCKENSIECRIFFKVVMVYVVGGLTIVCILTCIALFFFRLGSFKKSDEHNAQQKEVSN